MEFITLFLHLKLKQKTSVHFSLHQSVKCKKRPCLAISWAEDQTASSAAALFVQRTKFGMFSYIFFCSFVCLYNTPIFQMRGLHKEQNSKFEHSTSSQNESRYAFLIIFDCDQKKTIRAWEV